MHLLRKIMPVTLATMLIAACGARPDDYSAGNEALPLTDAVAVPGVGQAQPGLPGQAEDPAAALRLWADFPVSRVPRPIVLLEQPPKLAGFTTGEAKMAGLAGKYELATTLPATPPTVRLALSDGAAEFPTLPVDQALAGLRAGEGEKMPVPDPPLRITHVELGTAEFSTDRGPVSMPSWLFTADDTLGPIAWPAVGMAAFWAPGAAPPVGQSGLPTPGRGPALGGGATISADGRTVTMSLPKPTAPCPGGEVTKLEPILSESPTAVVYTMKSTVVSTAPGTPEPDCARTLMLEFEKRTVTLPSPLGARVLIDAYGSVVALTTA